MTKALPCFLRSFSDFDSDLGLERQPTLLEHHVSPGTPVAQRYVRVYIPTALETNDPLTALTVPRVANPAAVGDDADPGEA